jgi:hypothetical protein
MGQIWTKLAKINQFSNFFDNFSHFLGRGTHRRQFWTNTINKWDVFKKNEKFHFWSIFANFSHILWTKNHVLTKVGRTRAGDLFKFWYFLNLHALGYPKSITKKICAHFWVNKSLSMMWPIYMARDLNGAVENHESGSERSTFLVLVMRSNTSTVSPSLI